MSVRISVIIPCYRCAQTIETAIDDLLEQQNGIPEIIAVDDGSDDDTGTILDRIAQKKDCLKVIHKRNGGVSSARNAGIEAATGEWLFFMDADDRLPKDGLRILAERVNDDVDIVCGAYEMHFRDENGRRSYLKCAEGDRRTIFESLIRGDSALNSMCARLYRTSLIRDHAIRVPEEIRIGEDVLFNLQAFFFARAWCMTESTVYFYEYGGISAMTQAKKDIFTRSMPMIDQIGAFIRRHGLETELFRAHLDLYTRMLRADRGRIKAAFAFDYTMIKRLTDGVQIAELDGKHRFYVIVLRILPCLSYFLP